MENLLQHIAKKYQIPDSDADWKKLQHLIQQDETGLNIAAEVLMEKYPTTRGKGYDPLMIIEKSHQKCFKHKLPMYEEEG